MGGAFLASAIVVFARSRFDRLMAIATGVIVLGWISVQVAIIGYVSWMQPTTAISAVVILGLGWLLPRSAEA